MATLTRPALSVKNKYYINKHRYYELKHFCLQYPEWQQEYSGILSAPTANYNLAVYSRSSNVSDPTSKIAEERSLYFERIKQVERAAISADPELAKYILKAVTEGLSYTYLKSKLEIPCSKDTYYDRYRRFFWLLDSTRN